MLAEMGFEPTLCQKAVGMFGDDMGAAVAWLAQLSRASMVTLLERLAGDPSRADQLARVAGAFTTLPAPVIAPVIGGFAEQPRVLSALLEAGPERLHVANRSVERALALVEEFAALGKLTASSFDELEGQKFGLIINATSAGLGGDVPPFPASLITEQVICYDLSYGLNPTPFSNWAREQGAAQSVMGWGMLVEQAAESFEIWRGVRPDTAPVLKQMHINA